MQKSQKSDGPKGCHELKEFPVGFFTAFHIDLFRLHFIGICRAFFFCNSLLINCWRSKVVRWKFELIALLLPGRAPFFTTRIGASVWSRVSKGEKWVREGNWMECMHCVWPRVSRSWSQHEKNTVRSLKGQSYIYIYIYIYSQSLAGSQKVMKQS